MSIHCPMGTDGILKVCGFANPEEVRRVAAANSLPIEEPPVVRHLAETCPLLSVRIVKRKGDAA